MFKVDVKVKFSAKEVAEMHAKKMRAQGVQAIFTSKVVRDTDPYVPMDTGMMATSPIRASNYDEGEIVYDMPYARKQYYGISFNYSRDKHPKATHHWFETAKAVDLNKWGEYLAMLIGGLWRRK